MILAINKMDDAVVGYREERYNEIKTSILKMLKDIGFGKADEFNFIPTSGWIGDNILENSTNMPWYKGPCLIDAIDGLKPPKRPTDKPLRLPINDVYKINGVGTVPAGRVESGELIPNMIVVFSPTTQTSEVKSIEMHHEALPKAGPGDNVGFNVRGLATKDIKKGYVVGDVNNDAPKGCESFDANIIIMNHPKKIVPGYTPVLDCHTSHMACKFDKFYAKLDPRTMKVQIDNPTEAIRGECVLAKIVPTKPLTVESFEQYPALGRFAVRDMKRTVAVGVVINVHNK
jgi:elongation factor 1-alpha